MSWVQLAAPVHMLHPALQCTLTLHNPMSRYQDKKKEKREREKAERQKLQEERRAEVGECAGAACGQGP